VNHFIAQYIPSDQTIVADFFVHKFISAGAGMREINYHYLS